MLIVLLKLVQILEALTTERCCENFSLERLEVLGDAFLKFAVGRCLFLKHDALDEGQLTRKRSNIVNNSNLLKLATKNMLQVMDISSIIVSEEKSGYSPIELEIVYILLIYITIHGGILIN